MEKKEGDQILARSVKNRHVLQSMLYYQKQIEPLNGRKQAFKAEGEKVFR